MSANPKTKVREAICLFPSSQTAPNLKLPQPVWCLQISQKEQIIPAGAAVSQHLLSEMSSFLPAQISGSVTEFQFLFFAAPSEQNEEPARGERLPCAKGCS